MVPEKYKNVVTDDVVIGAHAIVGAGTTILPGATLGDGASIGAGSLVKGHLAPWTIHAGSPTRIIRPRLKRCLELEAELRREEAASPERE